MTKKWEGSPPIICQACGSKFGSVFYDAYLRSVGRWGLFCHQCFTSGGGRLGPGCGQKYSTATKEKLEG